MLAQGFQGCHFAFSDKRARGVTARKRMKSQKSFTILRAIGFTEVCDWDDLPMVPDSSVKVDFASNTETVVQHAQKYICGG